MTREECAIISAYTGVSMLQGDDLKYLYDYLGEVTKHLVSTVDIPRILDKFHEKIKLDFEVVCEDAVPIKPMPPVIGHGDTCGNCGERMADGPTRYCPWCGREIDWGD